MSASPENDTAATEAPIKIDARKWFTPEIMAKLDQPTMPLLEAGKLLFGLKSAATYAAAARGEIPVIRVGKKFMAPTIPLRRMLGMDAAA